MASDAKFWLFLFASVATLLPFVVPWLQAERGIPIAWERKAAFLVLVANAFLLWILLADRMQGPVRPEWAASAGLVAFVDVLFGGFLAVRGFALAAPTRVLQVLVFALALPAMVLGGFILASATA